ncbi:EAL domain-containing protein [uncultured Thiodictyon sp.]|uniref:EAL domain-containing protein n=1 Tax=uncultured Thiodictyon sp. TaxID=1846217 RepID=UPI0025E4871B|nr:EAL domain-containing protein [uncultured Thiodictyon sp.]
MIETLTLADLCRSAAPLTLFPDDPVSQAVAAMGERRLSSVVLVADGRPVGIFTERDALGLIARGDYLAGTRLGDLMSPDPLTAAPHLNFVDGYALMAEHGFRHLVLVDDQGQLHGVLSETDFARALGADEFLGPRTVADLMTRTPATLPPDATVATALGLMAERAISSVVIVVAGQAVGILSERDAIRLTGADLDLRTTPLATLMSRPLHTIGPDRQAHEASVSMQELGIRRLVVEDAGGGLVGILTRHDLVKDIQSIYLRLLRQVVADQGQALQDARAQLSEQSVLRTLLERSEHFGIVAVDAGHAVRFINGAALAALGLNAEGARSLPLPGLLAAAGLATEGYAERLAALVGAERLTLDLIRPTGSDWRWLRLVTSAIRDGTGRCEGYLLSIQDLTQERADAERLRAIVDSSPAGIGLGDMQGRLVLANPAFLTMLGYQDHPQELLGRHFSDFTDTEDRPRDAAEFARLLAGQVPSYRLEKRYLRRDGRLVRADVTVSAIRDATGRITAPLALVMDISDLRRAQESLLEAQALTHLGSWELDLSTNRLLWSDEVYRIFGLPPGSELTLEAFLNLVHEDDRERVAAAYAHSVATAGDYDIEHRVRRPDGRVRWVRERGGHTTDAAGRVIRTLGTVHDITEDHAARHQQRLINTLFESTSEGILITDADNRIVAVNPAFTAITGYSAAEVAGRNPRLLQSGRHDAAFYRELWEQLGLTGTWGGEVWNRRKNGEVYPQWLIINQVRGPDGRVQQHLAIFSDESAAQRSAEAIEFLSHHDPLTGLPNLTRLRVRLTDALERASAGQHRLALLVLDLDRFQDVIASHGHLAGDEVLKALAARLAAAAQPADILARLAGDSFVIARALGADLEAVRIAQDLQQVVNQPLDVAGLPNLTVTASIGVAVYPEDGIGVTSLLRNAESALKRAKEAGRNGIACYRPEMTADARRRVQLESELRSALAEGEFRLFYQPIVCVATGAMVAAEALIRWQHPRNWLLLPAAFIDAVEHSDLIHPIGRWVLTQAVAQARDWQALARVRVSINVAGPQIASGELARDLEAALDLVGLDPGLLEIEVLERFLLRDPDQALAELQRVHDLGVAIALDDFGTGYSSLSYLKRLPVDYLKIDKSFIRHLVSDPGDSAIVRSTITMAHNLGIQVIAEGVETADQLAYLDGAGCDLVQGYLLSRPVAPEVITEGLAGGRGLILAAT